MNQNILVNQIVNFKGKKEKLIKEVLLVSAGVVFLTLTAQVRIYLPFTPVPITGQTFGILLIGLVYGRKLGMSVVGTYIAAGTLGLPLFTGAGSGIVFFKPSGGYIIGYFFAVMICGYLAEKGWTKSYIKTLFVILLAEIAIYFFGLVQLSFFVKKDLFLLGLYPFIIGDIIKVLLLTLILPGAWKVLKISKK